MYMVLTIQTGYGVVCMKNTNLGLSSPCGPKQAWLMKGTYS